MKITIEINTCKDCRHIDHSGGFTPGGELPVCHHRGAVYGNHAQVDEVETAKDILMKNGMGENSAEIYIKHLMEDEEEAMILLKDTDSIHWIHRVPKDFIIPSWCPLKNGEAY